MQKSRLRPLRLIRLTEGFARRLLMEKQDKTLSETPSGSINHSSSDETSSVPEQRSAPLPTPSTDALSDERDSEARRLLKRTPYNYIFGQAYGLWLYISLFLLTIVITNGSTRETFGIYSAIQTAINTLLYIVAFGLEDTAVTFTPRLLAERGKAAAGKFVRRLLLLRFATLIPCALFLLFGLPVLIQGLAFVPYVGSGIADNLRTLETYLVPITLYIVTASISNLMSAVCAARMHMHRVLVISGLGQVVLLSLGFLALATGWGLEGVLWGQAIAGTLTAIGFLIWLFPLLREQGSTYTQPLKPVLQLGFSAWQTNLVSGALFKQISIILLSIFVVGTGLAFEQIALFNIAFQLADAANVLLVAGFSGVGASALAAAYVGSNYERLARSWEVLIKITTLLAAPGLVFCLFNASNIIQILYNPEFYSAGSLLAIFLFFNLLYRLAGSTIHQASLYVINKPHFVVISQWTGLGIVIVLGSILIPSLGAAGALIADGIAKVSTGVLMLIFLLPHFPRKYALDLLGFVLRFIVAAVIAALPCILWQPTDRFLLVLSGALFVVLCLALLLIIKPLSRADIELLGHIRPQFQRYFRWFARG